MVQDLLERIKIAANKRDVPYQSLIKVWPRFASTTAVAIPG